MGHRSKDWGTGPEGEWEARWRQHGGRGYGRAEGWGGFGHGGPPPWAGLFGFGPGAGRGHGGRGPRARRGDVRSAILDVLREAAESGEQLNGYQVIGRIEERSQGSWKPSPGSVYPTISQLQDEELVAEHTEGGRRALRLTGAGTAYVADHASELAAVWAPFAEPRDAPSGVDLKPEIGQVMSAVWQILTTGTERQRGAAVDVLVDARRRLYGILADGDETDPENEDERGTAGG